MPLRRQLLARSRAQTSSNTAIPARLPRPLAFRTVVCLCSQPTSSGARRPPRASPFVPTAHMRAHVCMCEHAWRHVFVRVCVRLCVRVRVYMLVHVCACACALNFALPPSLPLFSPHSFPPYIPLSPTLPPNLAHSR
eukprot:4436957-Pleurochrysis_carterae.AAC.1